MVSLWPGHKGGGGPINCPTLYRVCLGGVLVITTKTEWFVFHSFYAFQIGCVEWIVDVEKCEGAGQVSGLWESNSCLCCFQMGYCLAASRGPAASTRESARQNSSF